LPHHLEEVAQAQDNRFKRIFSSNEKDIPDEMLPQRETSQQDDLGA